MKNRCCIYCRIDSTGSEVNIEAIEAQRQRLRKVAEKYGLEIVSEKVAFERGSDWERNSIKGLIQDIKHGAFDCILVENLSHLTRSAEDIMKLGDKLNKYGGKIFTANGSIELTPPRAYFYARMATKTVC